MYGTEKLHTPEKTNKQIFKEIWIPLFVKINIKNKNLDRLTFNGRARG